jgi:hypothetical protein
MDIPGTGLFLGNGTPSPSPASRNRWLNSLSNSPLSLSNSEGTENRIETGGGAELEGDCAVRGRPERRNSIAIPTAVKPRKRISNLLFVICTA